MKICWDNLEGFRLTSRGNLKKYEGAVWDVKICENCGEEFLAQRRSSGRFCDYKCSGKWHTGENNSFYGKTHTKEVLDKIRKLGKDNPRWDGGYNINNIPKYDSYAHQIDWCESVRRNQEDQNVLEVKCTYCGKWYIPTIHTVRNRIRALEGYKYSKGELRFYCSEHCKQECPVYGKTANSLIKEDDIKNGRLSWLELGREVQPELRQMVFERDGYTCQKCGREGPLHCHHVEGLRWAPLESADVDGCITVCKRCHKAIHKKDGCGYNDLKCNNY